jgi:hypothetical protein
MNKMEFTMKINKYLLMILLVAITFPWDLIAQERITARGTSNFRKIGVHRGNQVRTVFSNYGVIAQPGNQGPRGAWKYDANGYVGDISPLVGLRLPIRDYRNGENPPDGKPDTIYSVIITPVDRPGGGESGAGQAWGFEPIPGFANPILNEPGKGVAMSHQPETWPNLWPDYPSWTYSGEPVVINGVDVTPKVDWNGYFGRGQITADQESYFWMDDFADLEFQLRHGFVPDTLSPLRTGHAIQVSVRGLQWANFLAKDVIFWLYNIRNDGTSTYDQAVFGVLVGTYVGVESPEWNDDASFFDIREGITYTWDFDKYISPAANPQWRPDPTAVGYIAYAFLESPGNPFDGIDNDGDNDSTIYSPTASYFAEADFAPRTVRAGDRLVLIDKNTFARSLFTMPNDTITVYSMGVPFFLEPNVTVLSEGNINITTTDVGRSAYDGIDNDLDGLIDENYLVHYRQLKRTPQGQVLIDILAPVQYKNYITGQGTADWMIDEGRDDLIDNDRDWNPEFDDVGADGKPGTGDYGEGDGMPTPGEPNFDQTDVDESDQIGLTSFEYFVPAGDITMSNDFQMWGRLTPGYFEVPTSIQNNVAIRGEDGDFMYGSGYFPLLPGKTERFSLALAFGDDFNAVLKTKRVAQTIYNANYNFPKPPDMPTLTAVPGDRKVTLYWDRVAENSIDPTLRVKDFEGYKIYKGTDPDLSDALQITDGTGQKVFYRPIAQFDLINGIKGFFTPSPTLQDLTSGAPFNLGNDNGIQNYFVDTDVINGRTYYYAVVAYDRGDASKDIFPSENTRFIAKDALGNISTDLNTAAVIPNAYVAGYIAPESGVVAERVKGFSTAVPYFEVVDPIRIGDSTYYIRFNDSLRAGIPIAYSYNIINAESGNIVLRDAPLTAANGIVFNGVRLSFNTNYQHPDSVKYSPSRSGWNTPHPKNLRFAALPFPGGVREAKDYLFLFNDNYTDSSNAIFGQPARKTNFQIFDITNPAEPKRIQFVFSEPSPFRRDTLSFLDQVTLSNETGSVLSWRVQFGGDSLSLVPKAGDSLIISINRPFNANDEFVFTTEKGKYSNISAAQMMNDIRVVPNPYVVTNVFEQPLPPQVRGRGERVINFINLPPLSKVHIYTAAGSHVRTLEHDGSLTNGSMTWDVRTKEGLDVAYGVYFYVVEAEGISEKKMGKLAIIK